MLLSERPHTEELTMALEMTLQSQIKAQIAELIHARRPKYKDQPYSWKIFARRRTLPAFPTPRERHISTK